jgi:hypothetical protein
MEEIVGTKAGEEATEAVEDGEERDEVRLEEGGIGTAG